MVWKTEGGWVLEEELRDATEEEKEDLEAIIAANKYNL